MPCLPQWLFHFAASEAAKGREKFVTGCKTHELDFLHFSRNKTVPVLPQSGALGSTALEFPLGGKPGSAEATIEGGFVLFLKILKIAYAVTKHLQYQ